jgi:hypothetical protein
MRSSNNSLNFDDQNTSSDIELLNNNLLEKPELN